MRRFLILFGFVLTVSASAQTGSTTFNDTDSLLSIIDHYIDSVVSDPEDYTSQFELFVVRLYRLKDGTKCTCYSLGVILNSSLYKGIYATHVLTQDGHEILVRQEPEVDVTDLWGLEKLDRYKRVEIVQRLYPAVLGWISSHNVPGVQVCWSEDSIKVNWYDDFWALPEGQTIWAKFPLDFSGVTIDELPRIGGIYPYF